MVETGAGTAVVTLLLLSIAPALGPGWVGVGGLLLLGVMTVAIIAGSYHMYHNAGLAPSLLPTVGVVLGIGVARRLRPLLAQNPPERGLGTVDVTIVLVGIAVLGCVLAYGVGRVWNR